jgi:hypothetical protein
MKWAVKNERCGPVLRDSAGTAAVCASVRARTSGLVCLCVSVCVWLLLGAKCVQIFATYLQLALAVSFRLAPFRSFFRSFFRSLFRFLFC